MRVPLAPRIKPLGDRRFKGCDQVIYLRVIPVEAAAKERLALARPQIVEKAFPDQSTMQREDARASIGLKLSAPHVPYPLPCKRAGLDRVELARMGAENFLVVARREGGNPVRPPESRIG